MGTVATFYIYILYFVFYKIADQYSSRVSRSGKTRKD